MIKAAFHFLNLGGRVLAVSIWHFAIYGGRAMAFPWARLSNLGKAVPLFGWMVAPLTDRRFQQIASPLSRRTILDDDAPESDDLPESCANVERPILVTGTHRSGTTWVGRMIALAPGLHYIHEPFNPNHDRGICAAKFDRWFFYVCEANERPYYRHLKRTMALRYSAKGKILQARSPRISRHVLRQTIATTRLRRCGVRPLIKGPIALFSAPWLAARFGMDVIVTIRHPAAFAGSIKIADWHFPFEDWVNQPLLMEDVLFPFAAEIEQQARHPRDVIDQAALLWKCFHHVILGYKAAHPEWTFVRHEDLSLDPIAGFRSIYEKLGLSFTPEIQHAIEEHSATTNPVGGIQQRHEVKLNSRANLQTWKERLSAEEVLRIRQQVEPASSYLYSPETWT